MFDFGFWASLHDSIVQWAINGWTDASGWQVLAFTLIVTHITIASTTIFLHRSQAHRALELHAIPSHFFRFWLWLTTSTVTKQWVAVHRKHHAKCETAEDPHSPVTRGIKTVLLQGRELYRDEATKAETLKKFGHGTPDDWLEHHLYTPRNNWGPILMLMINLALFGVIGITVWAVQMAWIPITAAGIINGLGHWWGYRNFEAPDASTNISPWGIIIGGEELHNNHHTYPTSAKLSVKPYEFDIAWGYIRGMEMVGLAKVRKTPPRLTLGDVKPVADAQTLEAIVANRYELMAGYAREVRRTCASEVARLKASGQGATAAQLKRVRRWVHRDEAQMPTGMAKEVRQACANLPQLDQLIAMREELRALWTRTNVSAEQLVHDLQEWCHRAESSGIAALQEFSRKLRAAHA
ncbi:MAG: aminotransferase [Burkholderiales bacterium RIFCSPLOWO2_12_FULL_64_99]|uniref:DesA family fatty acid desaturase n=1 Tax=Aquabacterium sp. TaxID=1872578 RepID=UPI0008D74CF7|nr:fatty acid desaturase [Aquabacterium sp.]OGB02746.1 MAG: aminotransferase [Burkholderiales bacterium RIFCSPHIGHO2_12_FULL_63_20]OGB64349.1 MAG: aminotransferase [Burkholderiales bacterium RIFCSPLOWO2_12_FULL_64_99]